MKKVLIATTICTAMLASCGQNSAEYKKLKAENEMATAPPCWILTHASMHP